MRYMTIAAVLAMLATQAQAESKAYRTELVPEKSVATGCSGWGQTYTVDVSNGVLTFGVNYARRLFSEPVTSDGKIAVSYRDPPGQIFSFTGHGDGEYELTNSSHSCVYRLVPLVGKRPWNS
jgi:hypothetical protein